MEDGMGTRTDEPFVVDEPETEAAPLAPAHQQDWFLEQLIDFASRGVELDVVLTIGGSHLAGTLVGGRKYFEVMASKVRAAKAPQGSEAPEALGVVLDQHAANYPTFESANELTFGEQRYGYIHLLKARWYSVNGQRFPTDGTEWRGRLAAVEGFTIGTLSTPADSGRGG